MLVVVIDCHRKSYDNYYNQALAFRRANMG